MNQNQIQTVVQPTQTAAIKQKSPARNIVCVILPILMAMCLMFGMTGCDVLASDQEVISSVKNGKLNGYTNKTVGKAFDDFLGDPIWTEFTADSGEHVVQVRGKCTYLDQPVTLVVQFVLDDEDGTFSLYTVTMNDIPQNALMQMGLLSAVYGDE